MHSDLTAPMKAQNASVAKGQFSAVEPLEDRIAPATFTVFTPADSGPGSLRQAILNANLTSDLDVIDFRLGGFGVFTIRLQTPLPTLSGPVQILGNTEPGYTNSPLVAIDASHLHVPTPFSGFVLSGSATSGSTIRGLSIYGFTGAAIDISKSNGNFIYGNYLGLTPDGTAIGRAAYGVHLSSSSSNQIGGTGSGLKNVISNNDIGVFAEKSSRDNHIAANYIGLDPLGANARPNRIGIEMIGGTNTMIDGKNVISGNTEYGLHMRGTALVGSRLTDNIIGPDATGTKLAGSAGWGIFLENASGVNIGSAGTRFPGSSLLNLISGNAMGGIWVKNAYLQNGYIAI